MIDIDIDALRTAAGIGVVGNIAGHLEQAGELEAFANVATDAPEAPRGLFPWYRPGADGVIGVFPLSSDRLVAPDAVGSDNLQIEPEVGVIFRAAYDASGRVLALAPVALAAFNDSSIRRPGQTKISDKKNWGPDSKGLAARGFSVGDIDADGALRSLRIASFVRREGAVHPYGVDSPAAGYTYSGRRLTDWMVDRLRTQTGRPDTPLEPVGDYLAAAGCPDTIVAGIGATRYTEFGEHNYLLPGDVSVIIVYDGHRLTPGRVAEAVSTGTERDLPDTSVLTQSVVFAADVVS
jgi:hypothetical protein